MTFKPVGLNKQGDRIYEFTEKMKAGVLYFGITVSELRWEYRCNQRKRL